MKHWASYLFLLPAILLLSFFAVVPMIQIFYYSALEYSFFGPARFVGIENYLQLLRDKNFWWTLMNSLTYVLLTPVLMIGSLSLALIVRRSFTGTNALRTVFFLPVVTPIVIAGIIWRWIFNEETGLFNYTLSLFSLPSIHWLTGYPATIATIMLVTAWRGAGYYMMIFLAGLSAIPKEVEEASVLDGAGVIQQAIHILVPLLKPTLTFVFVVSSTAAVKMFTEIYIMIPGAPMANKTLMVFLYQQAFERFNFGYASAIGIVLFLVTLCFSYFNIRLMEQRS